jgi:DNA-directed RNA polymerase subunit RPC12/RpoP
VTTDHRAGIPKRENGMTDETKKNLGIGLVVIGLLAGGVVLYRSVFGNSTSSAGGNGDIAVLCSTCGGFEIPADKFDEIMGKNPTPNMMPMMSGQKMLFECPKCGKKTCTMAHKCQKCGTIFILGQAKDQQYPDRCPKCRFSAIEVPMQNK